MKTTNPDDIAHDAISQAIDKAVCEGLELRECLAIALGVILGRYYILNNMRGVSAIERCHEVFLDEISP